ncbi:MAG: AMP-binding protein, partial [Solirubrobacteraceae bacterium]
MNFARDTVDAADPTATALVELRRDGERRTWTFGEVSDGAARLAGVLRARGVRRGDVVMTLIGNRAEWVLTMVACFRIGAVVLPCTEQLRPGDLRARIDVVHPGVIVADVRNRDVLQEALNAGGAPEVLWIPDPALLDADPAPAVDLAPTDGCLITFTSGTSGTAKPVLHGQRYLPGQALQAEHWLAGGPGDLVWCTAASG